MQIFIKLNKFNNISKISVVLIIQGISKIIVPSACCCSQLFDYCITIWSISRIVIPTFLYQCGHSFVNIFTLKRWAKWNRAVSLDHANDF